MNEPQLTVLARAGGGLAIGGMPGDGRLIGMVPARPADYQSAPNPWAREAAQAPDLARLVSDTTATLAPKAPPPRTESVIEPAPPAARHRLPVIKRLTTDDGREVIVRKPSGDALFAILDVLPDFGSGNQKAEAVKLARALIPYCVEIDGEPLHDLGEIGIGETLVIIQAVSGTISGFTEAGRSPAAAP